MTGNLDCLNPSSFGLRLHPQQQLRTWTLQLQLLNLPRPSCPLPGPTEWPPTAFQFLILPPTVAFRSPLENAGPLMALGLHRVLQWLPITYSHRWTNNCWVGNEKCWISKKKCSLSPKPQRLLEDSRSRGLQMGPTTGNPPHSWASSEFWI